MKNLCQELESKPIAASAACRIDCGGTLDIKTFNYTLRHMSPCTFNVALDMRTRVRLLPYTSGQIRVTSRGFEPEVYPAEKAPFDTRLGLMFAIAAYFRIGGVHIDIVSESPPRSGLGGSSAAAVALVAAISMALYGKVSPEKSVLLAHGIEESIAGVPCGLQDQLAAAFGGVNAWYWLADPSQLPFTRSEVLPLTDHVLLEHRLLIAYCGEPHESCDINGKWVRQFVSGKERGAWNDIVDATHSFVKALRVRDWASAVGAMDREVDIRRRLTPDVFDPTGVSLLDSARGQGCSARFTGAGGGGCVWALGEPANIDKLRPIWKDILGAKPNGALLNAKVDTLGLDVI